MSVKKKVGAIAAALTTVCGMSAAAAIPASAAPQRAASTHRGVQQ